MAVRFDSTPFEFAHGRAPRGRGSWGFCENRGCEVSDPTFFFVHRCTFAAAKRTAEKMMRAKYGAAAVVVLFVCS